MLVAGGFADTSGSVCAQLLIPAVLSWPLQELTPSLPQSLASLPLPEALTGGRDTPICWRLHCSYSQLLLLTPEFRRNRLLCLKTRY